MRAHPDQLNEVSEAGYTALHIALLYGHGPIVEWLLANGADIHTRSGTGDAALHFAAMRGSVPFIRTLLARGPTRAREGRPSGPSCMRRRAIVTPPRRKCSPPLGQDQRKTAPLRAALQRGGPSPVEFVRVLLRHGAKADIGDAKGETPLHAVALSGQLDVAPLLLAAGANVNARDGAGKTPLHLAIQKRHGELVKQVLAQRGDPNVQDADGITPLHEAVWADGADVADALIARGAKVNVADSRGWTPLWYAVRLKRTAAVELLRRHGGSE